jgi:DUF1680 family protein
MNLADPSPPTSSPPTSSPQAPGRAAAVDLTASPSARCSPVSPLAVRLAGDFWATRLDRNARVSLQAQHEQLERYGNLDNFRRLHPAAASDARFRGMVFADSDVYKWIEAVAWTLARQPDAGLATQLDEALGLIAHAQCADGYLNTYYALERAGERWSNLRDNHELYCAAHLMQAAVALHRALGDERMLAVATRFADLLCGVFGPASTGRNPGIDGHELIELALIELARDTGEKQYIELARHFVDARGHGQLTGGRWGLDYFQDRVPLRDQPRMEGHAVRALYFNAGACDLYLETGEDALMQALGAQWSHMVSNQIYVSGGLGSRHDGESLGGDHELPNDRAYTETCAAIASMMWCQRMHAATGEARYADLFEHTLYNAMLPGWSLDGRRYFYVNPLANDGNHRRQPWYDCACCPPNVARTLAVLPGSVYAVGPATVHVMLYADSDAVLDVDGQRVALAQRTRYPWDGEIALTVDADLDFTLVLRIPAWCTSGAALRVNGTPVDDPLLPGSSVRLARRWQPGDLVQLELPMRARLLESHPHVLENAGRVALMRGPLLYCVEATDHPGADLRQLQVGSASTLQASWDEALLDGVVVLRTVGWLDDASAWEGQLYREPQPARRGGRAVALTAVPYFSWHNRTPGAMQVWLRYAGDVSYGN